jgi:hypothetical protein
MTSVRRADSGPSQAAMEIRCSGCPETDHVVNTARTAMPSDVVATRFRRAGWEVGATPAADLCPACVQRRADLRPKTKGATPASLPRVLPKSKVESMTVIAAAPPREMSLEDRRVIFAKLNEVYIDERTGYSNGWSDKRVAEDLGVPRAWAEQIRAENFGPARDSEEVREFLATAAALRADVEKLAGDLKALIVRADAIGKQAADVKKVAVAIERVVVPG